MCYDVFMPTGVFIRSREYKEKMRQISLKNGNKPPPPKGRKMLQETKDKIRAKKLGIPRSPEVVKKMSKTFFKEGQMSWNKGKKVISITGERNVNWKGDKVGYIALHAWLKRHRGKADRCENNPCIYPRKDAQGRVLLKPKMFEWANKSHMYKRDLNDWRMLCASCHRKYDRAYGESEGA